MACTFAFLKDVRPYTTSWRVQVKILHSWRQYMQSTGETLEIIISDEQGKKMHATVKKDLVSKYAHQIIVGDWVFIETFQLNYASGQFRPTGHLYKMTFQTGTVIIPCDPKSDSNFLSLAKFQKIQNGQLNPYILVDAIGQIVTIGELENLEANNKPTVKIEFELRDETDERIACTLWGKFAEQVFRACQESDGSLVVCLMRFVKIKPFKGVMGLSNSFDATQIHVNPPFPEIAVFTQALPDDGLRLIFRGYKPKWEMVTVKEEDFLEFPRNTITELKNTMEIGKVRLLCSVYAMTWKTFAIS